MGAESQTSDTVLLVRPACFGFHAEAAQSNAFAAAPASDVQRQALLEFDRLAENLSKAGLQVVTLDDTADQARPDAVFPNNWVSFHADGTVVLYPMATAARRLERRLDSLRDLLVASAFAVRRIVDLSDHEAEGRFLEGTGSLILDRPNRRAFASLSPRTGREVIAQFDEALGYSTFIFDARDRSGQPIYHTNVLLSLGTRFAILCEDCVAADDRKPLADMIESSGRELVVVDYDQMSQFACNLIEIGGERGPVIALSQAALRSLRPDQLRALEAHGELVPAAIPTIESVGGGSVRCMIADIHLPRSS